MGKAAPELIKQAKTDRDSFNRLVGLYGPVVERWCRGITNNREDGRDIAQEAFIRLYRDLPQLQDAAKFDAWFRRLVANAAYDWFRKHRKHRDLVSIDAGFGADGLPAEPAPEASDLGEYIMAALDNLSANNRIVFDLFYGAGESCAGIARRLGLSETAVKNRLSRARERLREELAPLTKLHYLKADRVFNILILSCSHRRGGMSETAAARIAETIRCASPGSTVEVVCLADCRLESCTVCYDCAGSGRCRRPDDFDRLYDRCRSADAVLFVVPYYAPVPSKLAAFLERLMAVTIAPIVTGGEAARAFPLQGKWCGVLSFSQVRTQGPVAGFIRDALVAMGFGLILSEDSLAAGAGILDHAAALGDLTVRTLLTQPDSDALANWFTYWDEANRRTLGAGTNERWRI